MSYNKRSPHEPLRTTRGRSHLPLRGRHCSLLASALLMDDYVMTKNLEAA